MLGLGRIRKGDILAHEMGQLKFQISAVRDTAGIDDLSRCEDAEPVIDRTTDGSVFMCVADGLGGYSQGFEGKTGGYIASRATLESVVDYFCCSAGFADDSPDALTNHIYKKLRNLAERKLPLSRVRGTLGRHKLATTLAAVVFDDSPNVTLHKIRCYWIGDSRIYFFGEQGLHQLTRDDNVTESDAFDCTYESPPMSQFLAASMEREWSIHREDFLIDCPGVLIVCTDGCSAAWKSPWAFELELQKALEKSASWADWLYIFKGLLDRVRSDDASMAIYPLATGKFAKFKKLRKRHQATNGAVKAKRAEQKLEAREIWTRIYQPVYEAAPGSRVTTEIEAVKEPVETVKEPVETQAQRYSAAIDELIISSVAEVQNQIVTRMIAKPKPIRLPRFSFSFKSLSFKSLGLGGLVGFVCGLSLGLKIKPWLSYMADWIKSLWQFT